MTYLRKYGTAAHIYIPILKAASTDFALGADWAPQAGDVKIGKDGGAAANVTNLPSAIAMGNGAVWDFSITATESQAAHIVVTVADAATKAVQDSWFDIDTYGNASAQLTGDLNVAFSGTLTAGTQDTGTLPAGADAVFSDDGPIGYLCEVYAGTGATQARLIETYESRVMTFESVFSVALDNTSQVRITKVGVLPSDDYATSAQMVQVQDGQSTILSGIETTNDSLPIRFTQGTPQANFKFYMVQSAAPLQPATGLSVACQRCIDDGAFSNCTQATADEVGGGWYKFDISSADLDGVNIAFKFTATGAVQNGFTAITQPTGG